MKRYAHNLSSIAQTVGHIGRLQTVHRMPIVAGDSISMNSKIMMRFAALRRQLTVDCTVDIMTFFVPNRHIYGQDWIDLISDGARETVTLPSYTPGVRLSACACNQPAEAILPLYIAKGYEQIYNRYFNIPKFGVDPTSPFFRTFENNKDFNDTSYGFLCCRPHVPWSTGISTAFPDGVPVSSNEISILDLEKVRALYGSDQDRAWGALRYTDVLGKVFGTHVNIDADQRPEFVHRQTFNLSGYDVDGTAQGNLAQFSGKAVGQFMYQFPRKFFSEHGQLWTMVLPRFPSLHGNEVHPLDNMPNPSYKQISGDAQLWDSEPPISIQLRDWFWNISGGIGAPGSGLYIPYGQWYRHHPSFVHEIFDQRPGFPVPDIVRGVDGYDTMYYQNNEYRDMFNDRASLAEWQMWLSFGVDAMRAIPPAGRSIYAGAK